MVLPDAFTDPDNKMPTHEWHSKVLQLLARQLGVGNDFYFPLIGAAHLLETQQRDLQKQGDKMTDPIDELPTKAEREAARKIAAVLEPLSPEERRKLIAKALERLNEKNRPVE